jgi:hypothetical protein
MRGASRLSSFASNTTDQDKTYTRRKYRSESPPYFLLVQVLSWSMVLEAKEDDLGAPLM